VQPRVTEKNLQGTAGGRVTVEYRVNIFADRLEHGSPPITIGF